MASCRCGELMRLHDLVKCTFIELPSDYCARFSPSPTNCDVPAGFMAIPGPDCLTEDTMTHNQVLEGRLAESDAAIRAAVISSEPGLLDPGADRFGERL